MKMKMKTKTTPTRWAPLGVAGMALALASCTAQLNPNHCANQDGDAWCLARYGNGSRRYCAFGNEACGPTPGQDGCLAEEPPAECYSPCGAAAATTGGEDCLNGDSSDGDSSSGGTTSLGTTTDVADGESTTGEPPCSGHADCSNPAAPLCDPIGGACVACDGLPDGDAACGELDPTRPLCDQGACVQCTAEDSLACTAATPVCDADTHTCGPCTEHDQCQPAGCNLFTGACLPSDTVVHVGGSSPDFATLAAAIGGVPVGGEATIIVHGDGSYDEAATVGGTRTVALLAGAGDQPRWVRSGGGSPQLLVIDATVLLDRLQFSGNASTVDPAIVVEGGAAWIDRSRIITNDGGGLEVRAGTELVLRNAFVGGDVNDVDALAVDESSATILYSTLGAGSFNAAALRCTAPLAVVVRNSILVSRGGTPPDEIDCPALEATYSASEWGVPGVGNVATGAFPGLMPQAWFVDYPGGGFELQGDGLALFAGVAQWQAGDPPVDIDGQPRPAVDGAMDFAGADVP